MTFLIDVLGGLLFSEGRQRRHGSRDKGDGERLGKEREEKLQFGNNIQEEEKKRRKKKLTYMHTSYFIHIY